MRISCTVLARGYWPTYIFLFVVMVLEVKTIPKKIYVPLFEVFLSLLFFLNYSAFLISALLA
jgi:hypothetical protein